MARKGRIRQSVSRWCYAKYSLDDLSRYAAHIGLVGIDLLNPEEFEVPRRYGLICTMGYAGMGSIPNGLNRVSNHDAIEAALRKQIRGAVENKVPNLITFSGNRNGMSDDEGLRNCVIGLNRIKKVSVGEATQDPTDGSNVTPSGEDKSTGWQRLWLKLGTAGELVGSSGRPLRLEMKDGTVQEFVPGRVRRVSFKK